MSNMTVDVLDAQGKKAGKAELPEALFGVQANVPLMHQVVVAQLAAARQGTHSTKTRGEVRGGGIKPWRQKGTGRARQGSRRAPQWTGGGVVHGPKPRDYSQRTPKKMIAAALRGALSDRARDGQVFVVKEIVAGEKPSTKQAIKALEPFGDIKRVLVVLDRFEDVAWLSLRNIAEVHALAVDQLNAYDVLVNDKVVFTEAALAAFVAGPAKGKSVKAVATEAEALAEAAVAEAVEGQYVGDNPPKGYDIKGNADSGKYHTPESPWYGRTKAEVWFNSTAAAEAAGFVPAVANNSEEGK
ncbi:50S ribosomal protein L4 [Tessaracoccus sp. OH4464_COT-324]|uniref:50S ribosomal protein L4, sunset domain variant n=1 Tax=Tessaracoccus sp. OH4464_COT-324 TaxID=2491059 RepID=UPI000F62D33F|nr:50S ribosomal protein L4 [Tessaracoccus sp. OH4464_COT-324]RRD45659.1 50S ribosomal protein L4 [Tessaracoccus sp. OH4464_COT-324]